MGLHRGPELGQGAQHHLFKQHTSVESSCQAPYFSPSSPARGPPPSSIQHRSAPLPVHHEHPWASVQRCLCGHPLFNACILREERKQSSSPRSLPCSEPSAGSPSSPESDPQASLTGLGRPSSCPQPSLWLPPTPQTCCTHVPASGPLHFLLPPLEHSSPAGSLPL